MANPNTLRRPPKPFQTFLGPIIAIGDQYGFYLYQPGSANTLVWFGHPTKKQAMSPRRQLAKQPSAYAIPSLHLLKAIRSAVIEAVVNASIVAVDADDAGPVTPSATSSATSSATLVDEGIV